MFKRSKPKKRIYLDHAATTYLIPEVEAAVKPYWQKSFGNPSSLYTSGVEAKFVVEDSRKSISKVLNCRDSEIFFTAGGTESANMAVFGIIRRALKEKKKAHLIVSAVEHHAVLEPAKTLEREGVSVTYLPVDEKGFVNPKDLAKAIKPETVLVSVMYANNEIGTIQPISEISKVIKSANLERLKKKLPPIYFHSDACQAAGSLNLDVNKLGVDLISINASKIYGPKQVGLLYVRSGVKIDPLIYGGGQENGMRSGTENVPGVAGFAVALELAQKNRAAENKRLRSLRNDLIKRVQKQIPDALLNGPEIKDDSDKEQIRLANNASFTFKGIEGEDLLLYLDAKGIEVSTGSACASTSIDPSHVIKAIGRSDADARATVRFSFGKVNSKKDIDAVMKAMPEIVQELRRVHKLGEH